MTLDSGDPFSLNILICNTRAGPGPFSGNALGGAAVRDGHNVGLVGEDLTGAGGGLREPESAGRTQPRTALCGLFAPKASEGGAAKGKSRDLAREVLRQTEGVLSTVHVHTNTHTHTHTAGIHRPSRLRRKERAWQRDGA